MTLEDLSEVFNAERFPRVGANAHPDRAAVLAARSAITSAIANDDFLAECFSWELQRIEGNQLYRGLVPFFTIPDTGVRFAFGYWPPGGTPGPHEHTAWTITAVCRNELEVLTFDRDKSYHQHALVQKNCFQAAAGRVGYIYEPCIHQPRNVSSSWSLSFHASSPRDGEPLFDYDECLPDLVVFDRSWLDNDDPYVSVVVERQKQSFVRQLSQVVAAMNVPGASTLLMQCYKLASTPTQRYIRQQLRQEKKAPDSIWRLQRTHDNLRLSCRPAGDLVALEALTSGGPVEELVISSEVSETIAFIARERSFEVRALPGNLAEDEKMEIAEALEESGLFTRMRANEPGDE